MSRQAIIDRTIKAINMLPEERAEEISNFAEFMSKRYEEYLLSKGMLHIPAENKSSAFLNDEEDIYTLKDLKEVYNN